MSNDPKLDSVAANMRDAIQRYSQLLRESAGADFKSLTLFGTIVAGGFDPAKHVARSVVVLERIDLDKLRRLADHGKQLGKDHISAPLMMTAEYIAGSLDTFPLEFLEIQQKHVTIIGPDPFADLSFEQEHVRLQCERELKRVLIALRQGLLTAAGRDQFLAALERDAAEGLVRTMRGLLWLSGDKAAKKAVDVVTAVEKLYDRKLPGVVASLRDGGEHGWEEFQTLYHDVEALAERANA